MLARANFSDYIIGLLFAAQVSVAQTPQVKEALEAFTVGDYRTALKLYTEALDTNPTDTAAIFDQGLCHFNLGDYDQNARHSRNDLALSYLKVYLAATGDWSVSVVSDIGRVFQSMSRFDSAALYFAAAVQQDTALASSHFINLGLAYYRLKKYRL